VRLHRRKRKKPLRSIIRPIANSPDPFVSVVIPVKNERNTIRSVIWQASRVHPHTEVIVVANGSTDSTNRIAASMGARLIDIGYPLGHDVGRSIGAREARGSIILFVDGDIVIPARDLVPFVQAVEKGADVALNRYQGHKSGRNVHDVVLAKHALNILLNRVNLGGCSMTTIPHALSRKALDTIGAENLSVPPKAYAMAIAKGLNVQPVHFVNVGRKNARRRRQAEKDQIKQMIVGDHLEAIHWLVSVTNPRGYMTDLNRIREVIRW